MAAFDENSDWEDVGSTPPSQAPAPTGARAAPAESAPADTGDGWEDVPQWRGYAPVIASGVAQAAIKGVGSAISGIPEVFQPSGEAPSDADMAAAMAGTPGGEAAIAASGERPASPKDTAAYKAGEAVSQFGELVAPMSPTERESITGQASSIVGGMVPAVAAGMLFGPVTGMIAGAGQFGLSSAHEEAEAARAKGASPEDTAAAARAGFVVNAAGALLPLHTVLRPVERLAPGIMDWARARLVHALQSGVIFATIGEAQEWLGQQIAQNFYDPQAGYSFDVKRLLGSFLGGSFLGALTPTPYRGAKAERPAAAPEEHTEKLSDILGQPPGGEPPPPPGGAPGPAPEDVSILGGPRQAGERESLQEMLSRGAPVAELVEHPLVQAALEQNRAAVPTGNAENFADPEWRANRVYTIGGDDVRGWDNAVTALTQQAESASPFGPVQNDRRAIFVLGPPASGKSAISEPLARTYRAAIVDPDDAKRIIPEYRGGLGTAATHEESSELSKDVLRDLMVRGANLILPKVGADADSIRRQIGFLKEAGYDVDIVHVAATPEIAGRRNISRFLRTGRLVDPKYLEEVGDKPRQTAYMLRGEANDFADADTSKPGKYEVVEGAGALADVLRNGRYGGLGGGTRYEGSRRGIAETGNEPLIGQPVEGIGPHRVTAADGTAVNTTPIVIDADKLRTSQDIGYDPALQPRQRERAASQAQVRDIAGNLDPERLGYSAEADRGAPIVGPDGMVESGNGRVLALRRVYEQNGPAAQAYRDWLTRQGVDVGAYRHPVIVRQRQTPMTADARRAFTIAANQAATLAMSAPERAMSDAGHLTPAMLGLIQDPHDLAGASNRQFFRAFVAALPQSEQGLMADARGALSAEGLARVRNAILAKAYGDAGVVSRIAESTNDEIKSISNALTAAAPEWARFRAEIEAGRVRPDMDVTPDLMEAVSRTADLRARGDKLDEYLGQRDAFDRLSGPVEGFMRMFYDPKGRRAAGSQRISEAIRFYAEEASKVSAEKGLDLELTPVEPRDIQRLAAEKEWEDVEPTGVTDRGGAGDVTGGEAAGREARGPWLGEGRKIAGPRGERLFSEADAAAQHPTADELRERGLEPRPADERKVKFLDKKLRDLYRGYDVAYDLAINDGGASVRRLQAEINKVQAERDAAAGAGDPYKPLATFPGEEGTEARIYRNSDGKRFNVTLFDQDSGQALPSAFIVPTMEAAEKKARSLVERPKSVTEPGAEGKPQYVIPGAEKISATELLRRRAAEPLRPTVPQEIPGGLFGDLLDQRNLFEPVSRETLGLTSGEIVPSSVTRETANGPTGAPVRRGTQAVPGRQQPQRPVAAKRPAQLSLFGGPTGGGEVRPLDDATRQQPRSAEATAPAEGAGVTKPPARNRRDDSGRVVTPAANGLREAEQKIAERSRSNYRITPEDQVGVGGPKQKVRQNIDAIRVLKQIEDEGREATPGEKAILVKYVGWGAFAQDMFAAGKRTGWEDERARFRALVNDEEFDAAKASTLNAHFTSPDVIRGMWGAMSHLGFKGGAALEPAAGVGHFIGLIPDEVAPRTVWTAVELDPISARITKALYGGAEVNQHGFEELKRPSNYYDLAISNVPFGDYHLTEKPYGSFPIHDFFFVKSIDKVRPGGVVAFITSRYTMDRTDTGTRRLLGKTTDLVGAIRLPGGDRGAFAGNAGTQVTTDILFLRKKIPGEAPFPGAKWEDLKQVDTKDGPVAINEYFADHPQMMLGEMRLQGTMYRANEPVLVGSAEGLQDRIAAVARNMTADAMTPRATPKPETISAADIQAGVKDGGFFIKDGKLYQRVAGEGVEQKMPADQQDRVTRLTGIRDIYNDLLAAQLEHDTDGAEKLRESLRDEYDAFVKKYGPINKEERTVTARLNKAGEPVVITRYPNIARFMDDPDVWKVSSIENYDAETGKAKRADVQTKNVIRPPIERQINGPSDALAASLNDLGRVDLDHVAQSLNLATHDDAVAALGDLIFHNPDGRAWETADKYLSGDVVKKVEEARQIAKTDPTYLRNVAALEKVQPTPLTSVDITAQYGAPWVPPDVYQDFMREVLGARNAEVRRVPITGEWKVDLGSASRDAIAKYGHPRVSVEDIAEAALNGRQITVRDKQSDGSYVLNDAATTEARNKAELLKEAFTGDPERGIDGWVWQDPERTHRLEAIFNRTYNNLAPRKFDGRHLILPGLNPDFSNRTHRRDAVWRVVQNGNTLLAHVVGSGKTVTMIAAGMEQKRLGLISKPAYVVPNHMLEQFSREFIQAYPDAKILVAQKDEMTRENRKAFLAKTSSNDWDGIVITHDAFGRINMGRDFRRNFIQEQIDELERVMNAEASTSGKNSPTVKNLERAKKRLEERLRKLMAEERKDEGTSFEESGIDFLFVDEAHLFKNLQFITRLGRVKGLAQGDSQRAEDLFLKMRYLEQNRPGRSAVFATGTPVSNTMAELWTMQRYLQLDKLRDRGLENFDSWANTFGRVVNNMELSADGRTFKEVSSFSKFVNVPELIALYSEVADTRTADMLKLPRPDVVTREGKPGIEIVEAQPSAQEEAYIQKLVKLAEELKGKRPEKGQPNMLSVVTAGRKVATDGRLISSDFDFNPRGKVALAVDNIHRIWEDGNKTPEAPNKVQMVFLDMGVPQPKGVGVDIGRMWDGMENDDREKWALRAGATKELKPQDLDRAWDDLSVEERKRLRKSAPAFDPAKAAEDRVDLYADLKKRLVDKGIPANQIAAIHDATDDAKKARLFQRVRAGDVRVLLGSTGKMGVGTNVQDQLIAMHHLDAPWKPAEVEQRDGRIVRQGNKNDKVGIYRYVTKRSFDAFMWQKLDTKSKFIAQVLSGARGARTAEDIDNPLPEAAEMKAAASGDPRILEHAELDRQVRALSSQRRTYEATQARASYESGAAKARIKQYEEALPNARADADMVNDVAGDKFSVDLGDKGIIYDRKQAGQAILSGLLKLDPKGYYSPKDVSVGRLSGFDMRIDLQTHWDGTSTTLVATPSLEGKATYAATYTSVINEHTDPVGLIRRFESILGAIRQNPERLAAGLKEERENVERLEKTLGEAWPKEKEYRDTLKKLGDLTTAMQAPKHPEIVSAEVKAQAPWYYSGALRLIEAAKQDKASPEQWLGMLRNAGAKPDEMQWLDLEGWLRDHKGPVTKAELADYVRAHQVEVKEVEKNEKIDLPTDIDEWTQGEPTDVGDGYTTTPLTRPGVAEGGSGINVVHKPNGEVEAYESFYRGTLLADWNNFESAVRDLAAHMGKYAGGTKYHQYTLPGGENYRELLLTLPPKMTMDAATAARLRAESHGLVWNRMDADAQARYIGDEMKFKDRFGPDVFKSSHWDEPNVLAHIRFDDRDGGKTLHIAEVQSDWHQKGRKEGYQGGPSVSYSLETLNGTRYGHYASRDEAQAALKETDPTERLRVVSVPFERAGVPDAPFKTTWPELALKRMIRYAAENGYDRITWDTGDTNAERYDLSRHIDKVAASRNADGSFYIRYWPKGVRDNDSRLLGDRIPADKIADQLGKDLADKITKQTDEQGSQAYVGLDLKVGGEGMRGFYDKLLPAAANKLGKKYGAKVGDTEFGRSFRVMRAGPEDWRVVNDQNEGIVDKHDEGVSFKSEGQAQKAADDLARNNKYAAHSLPITPALRDAASGGFPLFRHGWKTAEPREFGPRPGERVVQLGARTVAHLSDKYTAAEQKIGEAIQRIGERMAPQATVQGARALRMEGSPIWGAFVDSERFPQLIAWSLEKAGPVEGRGAKPIDLAANTVRHEIIHHLRSAGLIRPDEWDALAKTAKKEGWGDKYGIDRRYPSATDDQKVEEAVAERFADWRADKETIKAGADPIQRLIRGAFDRLDLFMRRVAAAARQFLGKNATANDVFTRIETGEVGRRTSEHIEAQKRYFANREAAQTPELEARERRAGQTPVSIRQHITAAADNLRARTAALTERFGVDGIVRDMQVRWTPMAARDATVESRAIVKEYMNARRQAREAWNKADKYIVDNFTPEQRKKMWDAADEESVALQQNRSTQGIGLDRLAPDERAVVEMMQRRSQGNFDTAKMLGMVQGDGLPSYVPRMLVRMSEGKLEKGIGPGSEVVRDIRTLALANAKLEDAISAKQLVNTIKEIGVRSGNPTVNEGSIPSRRIGAEGLVSHAIDVEMGRGFSTTTPNLKHRKYLTREETEAAANRAPVADKDAPHWFTLSNPAFQVWRPKMVEPEWPSFRPEVKRISGLDIPRQLIPMTDQFGETVWERVPIYVRSDFEGPLKAALKQDWGGKAQQALMSLKSKAMSVIMFSPLIHNQVEWGRALPAAPGKVLTFETYLEGNRISNDPVAMREAISGGLVPIGGHGFMQDVVSIAEAPNIQPGHSWTAKGLGYGAQALGHLTRIYDPTAGADQVRRSVDWFGNLWHNTLLWDRVRDLQLGLWSHVKDAMIAKGYDPYAANVAAAHFGNRYAGALPVEAMSGLARGIANVLLFSRSFTLGNVGAYKDAISGLPRDAQALIQQKLGWNELQKVQSFVKRKSRAMLAIDAGLYYATLSTLQSAFHTAGAIPTMSTLGGMMAGNAIGAIGKTSRWGQLGLAVAGGAGGFGLAAVLGASPGTRSLEEELQAYWDRFTELLGRTYEHPGQVIANPFKNLEGLLSTSENEPGKEGRLLVGYDEDGSAIYMRLPAGKVTEDLIGWLTEPNDMFHRKMSTFAKPLDQFLENNIGFGRKAYNPNADTPAEYAQNIIKLAGMLVLAQVPGGPLMSAYLWARGGPGASTEGLKVSGQATGFTFSKGYPGGPELGVVNEARQKHDYRVQQEMPGIRDQIRQGDVAGAQAKMDALGIPVGLQKFYIATTINPKARLTKRQMQDFMREASPEEQRRFFQEQQASAGHADGGVVDGPIPKEGQTVPTPDIRGEQAKVRQDIVDAAADVAGITDAGRALRGEMTDDETKDFALTSAARAVPAVAGVTARALPALASGLRALRPVGLIGSASKKIDKRAGGGRVLPRGLTVEWTGEPMNRWGVYDHAGTMLATGKTKDEAIRALSPRRAAGGRVEPKNIDRFPTEAQKTAGNYAKDHVYFQGISLTIENACGSWRSGVGRDGKPWKCRLPAHYGYVKRSEGADGDHVDVYVGTHRKAPHVFIIDQANAETGKFDEHKAMIGFATKEQAIRTYLRGFSDGKGAKRLGHVTTMSVAEFKDWLKNYDTTAPFAAKQSHAAVHYADKSIRPNQRCELCVMFVRPALGGPACTDVVEPIKPQGWCQKFSRGRLKT